MSDDINIANPDLPEAEPEVGAEPVLPETQLDSVEYAAPEQPEADAQAALEGELNNLKDVFQQEWNKTMAENEEKAAQPEEPAYQPEIDFESAMARQEEESDGAPEIQALDYEGDPEDEPEDDAQSSDEGAEAAPEKKKKNKKEKKRSRVPLVILIIILVLILIPLLAYFILSVTTPQFGSFLTSYSAAMSAEDSQTKLTAYQDALTYCEDSSLLGKMQQPILEKIVVLTNETSGYSAARSYMTSNMTEEMIANPSSAEFKEFLQVGDKITEITDKAYDAVETAVNEASSAEAIDYDALHNTLGTPEMIKTEVSQALTSLAEAMTKEKTAKTEEDWQGAISGYLNGAQQISSLGGDNQYILEKVVTKLYNKGYISEAKTVIDNYLSEEALAAPKTEEFTKVQQEISGLMGTDVDLYSVAEALYKNRNTSAAEIKNAINVSSLKDTQKNVLVTAAQAIIDGLTAEEEKNLTQAQKDYANALNTLNTLEMDAVPLAKKLITVYLATGDTQNANTLREEKITDEVLEAADADFKAQIEDLDLLYAAQNAANEVFGGFYQNYYYSGAELDKEEIGEALDKLTEAEDANKYTAPFVAYYKYLAEAFTDENADTMAEYLETFAKGVADYPALYSASLGEIYKMQANFTEMEKLADQMLEINVADDFANGAKSLALRIEGKLEEALAAAEKGVELSGQKLSSAAEALICNILLKDYAAAAEYAVDLYDSNLTVPNCEYLLILNALYDGDDAALKESLGSYKTKIEEIFTNYSITVSENTQGIIDGTISPEDVFMNGKYYLF